jgi:L-arabinose isomerase
MYSDFTMITGQTGVHIEVLEIDDLQKRVDQVTDGEIEAILGRTRDLFEISSASPSDPLLIMDRLDAGGSFTELYAMDFVDQFLLMGHDGPFHLAIADGKPVLRGLGLYHGKRGQGISVEARVKKGPVTILGLTHTSKGNLKMLVSEGQSIPGPILRIGNTNSRIRFSVGPAQFMDAWCTEGPTHHCALGVGHVAKEIDKVARILGLEMVRIGT